MIGIQLVKLVLALVMGFLVIKLALILWDLGLWQDIFGIGK
jgi:hypothetical protein